MKYSYYFLLEPKAIAFRRRVCGLLIFPFFYGTCLADYKILACGVKQVFTVPLWDGRGHICYTVSYKSLTCTGHNVFQIIIYFRSSLKSIFTMSGNNVGKWLRSQRSPCRDIILKVENDGLLLLLFLLALMKYSWIIIRIAFRKILY